MLAQLVAAVEGDEAHLVFPNPGDCDIDVVVGNLNDRVRVWQAKYFARGVPEGQQGQIDNSFQSGLRAAGLGTTVRSTGRPFSRIRHSVRLQQLPCVGLTQALVHSPSGSVGHGARVAAIHEVEPDQVRGRTSGSIRMTRVPAFSTSSIWRFSRRWSSAGIASTAGNGHPG
jgi:hypothetical protein